MKFPRLLTAALVTTAGLTLTAIPGVAQAATWTTVKTTTVNYRAQQDKVRKEILGEVNRMRSAARKCGTQTYPKAPALTLNQALNNAAYLHSKDMATKNYFSHTAKDGTTFDKRITKAGYKFTTAGENIAAGYNDTGAVVAGWMASPGHCRNIMNPSFQHLGVGAYYQANSTYKIYWTNDFGRGSSGAVSDIVPK